MGAAYMIGGSSPSHSSKSASRPFAEYTAGAAPWPRRYCARSSVGETAQGLPVELDAVAGLVGRNGVAVANDERFSDIAIQPEAMTSR